MLKKLKQMIKEPASKEWFEKHAKGKALEKKKEFRNKDHQRTSTNPSALSVREQSEKRAANKASVGHKPAGHVMAERAMKARLNKY